MLFCVAAAIGSAIVFFGIFGKDKEKFGITEFSDIAGVEKNFDLCKNKNKSCSAVYIGLSYESLDINADSDKFLKIRLLAEKKTKEFCGITDGMWARVDRSNYVIASAADSEKLQDFCTDFLGEFEKFSNLMSLNIGCYISTVEDESFETAAGFAKKITRYIKKADEKFKICKKSDLKKILESESIEKNIESFIDNDVFYQVLQPLTDAQNGKIIGFEVLTRLDVKKADNILPSKFLSVIKESGLSEKFDLYTFKKCCKLLCDENRNNLLAACNFSKETLTKEGIAEKISDIVKETGARTENIIIEIEDEQTENGIDVLTKNISALKKEGFKICVDNFGKGNMAFGELSLILPDIISIDKSVLYGAQNEQGKAVFKNTVRLAKEMNAKVLCVGVENENQVIAAKNAGCDILQGFYYHKAIGIEEFDKLLEAIPGNKNI